VNRASRIQTAPRHPVAALLGVMVMAVCGDSAHEATTSLAPTLARAAAQDAEMSTADLPARLRALPVSPSPGSTTQVASAPAEVIFGTPASADRFAAMSPEPLPGTITYDADAIEYSETIAGEGAATEMSVRYYAPGHVLGGPQTPFDASSFHRLRLPLASTTDAVLTIRLVPDAVVGEACSATVSVLVDANTTELELDLDASTFSLSEGCAAGTAVATLKTAIAAIDIVNPATAAGAHDFRVGAAIFGNWLDR
jgi:hypothetical protein